METAKKSAAGRKRAFDREVALEAAMRLFWRHGYEGVSFQQLTTELGLAAPSLYAAFGNKADLYREALDRYAATRDGADLAYMDESPSLADATRRLLMGTAGGLVDPRGEIGCMLNLGMVVAHPDYAEIVADLAKRRRDFRELLAQKLRRWLAPDQAQAKARYLAAIMQGMAIQARDGATRKELEALAAEALGQECEDPAATFSSAKSPAFPSAAGSSPA